MSSALLCLEKHPDLVSEIRLDQQTIDIVEAPLKRIESAIRRGEINKPLVLNFIIDSEISEWNEIFLYVINSLKHNCPRFKIVGPSLQNHLRNIEGFIASTPDGPDFSLKMKKLSPVWEEKVLVVDDSQPIAELLSAIFSKDGTVDTAQNGEEAFAKPSMTYYAVIISDIDMPVMDGIEFYESIKKIHPDVGKRFIFISGAAKPETIEYLKREHIVLISKPFKIHDIRRAVYNIIDRITL